MAVSIVEGVVPFKHPSLTTPASTWYKIFGDLGGSATGRPLICLHGGPGACHNYLLPLQELAYEHGITVVMYDQLGCGNSTRLRAKRLDHDFWKPELFMSELTNLLDHLRITDYDLLGQSWGGMLGSQFATSRPRGLNRLVISNSPASMELWVKSCDAWRAKLPQDVEATLEKYEKLQEYSAQEYKDAVQYFYEQHFCRTKGEDGAPFPKPVTESLQLLEDDDTVYYTM
jgi:proline-specific peptidase